jgi:hypothetical protein
MYSPGNIGKLVPVFCSRSGCSKPAVHYTKHGPLCADHKKELQTTAPS